MEVTRINNYSFEKPLTSDNSGFSKWGIGYRGGKAFFVKEFLSPVYPEEDSAFTEKKKQERIRLCQSFVEKKIKLYSAIREASDGHIVSVEQFFRVGAKFYISTIAITGSNTVGCGYCQSGLYRPLTLVLLNCTCGCKTSRKENSTCRHQTG